MNIAFYITGHGFGHAARSIEIINALYKKGAVTKLYLRTSVPEWFFFDSFDGKIDYDYHHELIDVGVVQKDALRLDKKATLFSIAAFLDSWNDLILKETSDLRSKNIDLIISDITPVAFLIADKLNLPSIAISNFIWSWIYKDYVKEYPDYGYVIEKINMAYSKALFALRYPFYGDFFCFKEVFNIGLVARKSDKSRADILKGLGLPIDFSKKIILIAFGGFSVELAMDYKSANSEYHIIYADNTKTMSGITVPDMIAVSDAVIGKPGYGMVSECIAAQTPFLYTSRGDFAEYRKLVEGMKKYIPAVFIPNVSLLKGDILPYLDKLFSLKRTKKDIVNDGALEAAEKILYYCQKKTDS